MKYALIDFEGLPIRYFDYPAAGTVKLTVSYLELLKQCGDCLF